MTRQSQLLGLLEELVITGQQAQQVSREVRSWYRTGREQGAAHLVSALHERLRALSQGLSVQAAADLERALSRGPVPCPAALASAPACLRARYEEALALALCDLEPGQPEELAQRRAWSLAWLEHNTPRWVRHGELDPEGYPTDTLCLGLEYQGRAWAWLRGQQDERAAHLLLWSAGRWRLAAVSGSACVVASEAALLRWGQVVIKNNRRARLRLPSASRR